MNHLIFAFAKLNSPPVWRFGRSPETLL